MDYILYRIIILAILLFIGVIGNKIKSIYDKKTSEETKEKIVKYVVDAVNYFYKDLPDSDKEDKIKEYVNELFDNKNISVTDIEKQILLGSCLKNNIEKGS